MKNVGMAVVFLGLMFAGAAWADPYDCTGGCTVITCDGTTCYIFHCEAGDCWLTGSYPDPNAEVDEIEPDSASSADFSPVPGNTSRKPLLYCNVPSGCAAVTCAGEECKVFGFHQGEISELGTVGSSPQESQALLKLFQAENLLESREQ